LYPVHQREKIYDQQKDLPRGRVRSNELRRWLQVRLRLLVEAQQSLKVSDRELLGYSATSRGDINVQDITSKYDLIGHRYDI
jgi:hypothetical protein